MNIRQALERVISRALVAAGAPEGTPAMVAPSARPEFGDYQANGIMAAAKKLKINPHQLAKMVKQQLLGNDAATAAIAAGMDRPLPVISDMIESLDVAGPGFINIKLKEAWLEPQLRLAGDDEHLAVARSGAPQTVVVDYSAPNLAKEMHVGHLRSTIIGDALARTLEFLGHHVIRQNHVGDWGTQFGMLTAHLDVLRKQEELRAGAGVYPEFVRLVDLEEFYREAKKRFDDNPRFAEFAREYVVKLQAGDPGVLASWKKFRALSMTHCIEVYQDLDVSLRTEDIRGESAYNDDLPKVVADLKQSGLLSESQGAQCVFLPEFVGKDGVPLPFIVQKTDEGYLYATTDLAAIRYRVDERKANRILYVVDARQSLHFRMLFAVARKAGFAPDSVQLEHIGFGTMNGPDGKPFKTREGGTVKLMDLLNQAQQRAFDLVTTKSPEMPEDQRRDIARAVGIGGVKYADLSQNRTSDYVFSFDKMLSMEGNTAPYMQYAYARIRSIFRKGLEQAGGSGQLKSDIVIGHPAERALAVKLLQFSEAVETVAAECMPNLLCAYLYDLASAFTGFYENCPVLKSDEPVRSSRLALCDLTARTIRTGLGLLGIATIEQM